MKRILKYSFFDMIRSRWSIFYFLFFLITASSLLYMSNDSSRALASLMNIVIILCPLIGTLFGVMYYYNSRDFIELLLAQPIKRRDIFLGEYFGLAFSIVISFIAGITIPFIFYGFGGADTLVNFLTIVVAGSILTMAFLAISFLVAMKNSNKIKGFGLAIIIWLFMAIIYDGLFLMSLFIFEDYPLETFSLAMTVINPIDLCRTLVMLQLDISALLGYTGAVFNKFFGTSQGIIISLFFALLWVAGPVWTISWQCKAKDF
ncbi:ABC transporter permease [Mangrovivirga sp. M17]|uniref:ABC transporter permease n=1 Tax=Mangrovivirga halotolerans TaxID=2993936 RepID=A0ABT3RPP4_9BACT|nr:ABC transporter permease subunit [Mangrovivirga halotolerans]MCX2743562.1 ABC transporter permease [Mangrovivirga halotolerans]